MYLFDHIYYVNTNRFFNHLHCAVGKPFLLTLLTGTRSTAASYGFKTLACIPGIIHYNDTRNKPLDLSGVIEGAFQGKGIGRQCFHFFLKNTRHAKRQALLHFFPGFQCLSGPLVVLLTCIQDDLKVDHAISLPLFLFPWVSANQTSMA